MSFTIHLNPRDWFSPVENHDNSNEKEQEIEDKQEKPIEYKNEFTQIYYEFINDLTFFREKYPLISLIATIAFAFLGIWSFFSLSITGLVTSGLYFTLSYCLAKNIGNKGKSFFSDITNSFFRCLGFAKQEPKQPHPHPKEEAAG